MSIDVQHLFRDSRRLDIVALNTSSSKTRRTFFEDEDTAQRPRNQAKLDKDERTFLDKSKIQMYVVYDVDQ
jgi:hypothetical protein